MGSLGLPEIIFIMVIALLIFGPKRLPEIGRTLGKGMAEFRKATNDLKQTITTELTIEDEQPAHPRRVDLASVAPIVTPRPLPAETMARDAESAQQLAAAGAAAAAAYDRAYGAGASSPSGPVVVADAGEAVAEVPPGTPAAPVEPAPAAPSVPALDPNRPIEPS
jgi:sec-independent protein translocase protein TatA